MLLEDELLAAPVALEPDVSLLAIVELLVEGWVLLEEVSLLATLEVVEVSLDEELGDVVVEELPLPAKPLVVDVPALVPLPLSEPVELVEGEDVSVLDVPLVLVDGDVADEETSLLA